MRCRAFLAISRATGVKKETPSNSPFIYIYIYSFLLSLCSLKRQVSNSSFPSPEFLFPGTEITLKHPQSSVFLSFLLLLHCKDCLGFYSILVGFIPNCQEELLGYLMIVHSAIHCQVKNLITTHERIRHQISTWHLSLLFSWS